MKIKQTERVYKYMQDFGSITQLQAIQDLGVYRLASRISDLKKQGYGIVRETITSHNRYGEQTHFAKYSIYKGAENND